jgi:ClpA/ClpB-like protein
VQPSVVELARRAAELGDPRVALSAIADLRRRLEELEEYHVETALARGASWSEIGSALGISKQAAHKRFATRVVGRTDRQGARMTVTGAARLAVRLARAEAARAGIGTLAPEHLLLGLLRLPQGGAAQALSEAGLRLPPARLALAPRGSKTLAPRDVVISRRTRAVLEQALEEALVRGDEELGDIHVLLAVLHGGGSGVRRKLELLGVAPRELLAVLQAH